MVDEKLLYTALDLVDLGLAIVGADGRLEWCNAAYAEFLGRPVGELIGSDFFGDGRPCDEVVRLRRGWGLQRRALVSGDSASGPVDVAVGSLAPHYDQRLVIVQRAPMRRSGSRYLPSNVVEELCDYVAELTGHAPDPTILAIAPLSILMLMIAEIDSIRGAQGDEAVEEVMRQVAQALVLQKRKSDVIARYRGGQFLVLAPHTPRYSAAILAERIRRCVSTLELGMRGEPLAITLLLHVTEYRPQLDGSVSAAVEKASAALATQGLQVVS